ncbi:MAG: DNA polymerase III subunit gamma/tau [Crocinitomicaceae bacterium]
MSDYVVSARKYRPQTFDSVVGQSSITNTLKNSIKTGHLAQAFLFCGTRGVGKTTTARILAKTINCMNRKDNIEPCDECDSCKSFNEGQSLNIYELDAASNNSVDDIRALVDQVRIAPQLGNYKVYIIDEVHMLSSNAFNAFLKTLEEPPKHAIFILATTEKHKIIPTILSRCQIFDFHRIKVEDMVKHLEGIAENEGVSAEHDGLTLIAQKAEGGLRDALSLFDQIVSSTNGKLTYENVILNLNILDYDYFFRIVEFMNNQDIPEAMLLYNEILERGFDGSNFLIGIAEHFRNLMICKDPKTHKMLELGDKIKQKYLDQSTSLSLPFIIRALGVISQADVDYKTSKNKRLLVEICLMQLCSIKSEQEKKNP